MNVSVHVPIRQVVNQDRIITSLTTLVWLSRVGVLHSEFGTVSADPKTRECKRPVRQYARAGLALISVSILGLLGHEYGGRVQWLSSLQQTAHAALSHLDPRVPRAERVALVEIDDTTFWSDKLKGRQPVDRRILGEIVRTASDADAAVIALDLQLKSPYGDRVGDYPDSEIQKADQFLLAAIQYATQKGVPVILGCGLVRDNKGLREEPGIFPRDALPALVETGYINLPRDMRTVPLQTVVFGGEHADVQESLFGHELDSFALQIVGSYEKVENIEPHTKETALIARALANGDPVYVGFLKPNAFPRVSALDIANRRTDALSRLRHRIVIVGGTWHQYSKSVGPLIENFATPTGPLPGLYVHANYVEALLDGRVKGAISWSYALLLDLILGVALIVCFHITRNTTSRLAILAVFLALVICAYLFPVNFGLYLEFVLPLGLLVIHLGSEHYLELRHRAKRRLTDATT